MRMPRSTSRRASATDVERYGTNLGLKLLIDTRASTEKTKVPTKTPSVIWLPKSRTKLRIIRGPNCCEARVKARMVMEKTTPITVMTAAAIAMSTCLSASALPVLIHTGSVRWWWKAATSISKVTTNSSTETTTRMLGTTQSVVRSSSQRQLGRFRRSLSTRAGCGATPGWVLVMRWGRRSSGTLSLLADQSSRHTAQQNAPVYRRGGRVPGSRSRRREARKVRPVGRQHLVRQLRGQWVLADQRIGQQGTDEVVAAPGARRLHGETFVRLGVLHETEHVGGQRALRQRVGAGGVDDRCRLHDRVVGQTR